MAALDLRFTITKIDEEARSCNLCGMKYAPYAISLSQPSIGLGQSHLTGIQCPRCLVRIGYALQQQYPYRSFREYLIEDEPGVPEPSKRKLFEIS